MSCSVHLKCPRLTEPFATNVTLEWLLLRVNELMVSKVILTAKGFATGVAGIGSFIGMGSLVDQQIIGLGKMSITVLADELLFRSVRFTTGATSARKQKPRWATVRRRGDTAQRTCWCRVDLCLLALFDFNRFGEMGEVELFLLRRRLSGCAF